MSEKKTVKKKKRWGKVYEYQPNIRDIVLTEDQLKEIEAELKKSNVYTPQSLANKFNIKVSLAKKILNKQVEAGKFKEIASTSKSQVFAN